MKDFKKYLDKKHLLFQKSGSKQNYIDSNFLNTNSLFQKSIIGDTNWFNNNGLEYMSNVMKTTYRANKGVIRRYSDNFGALPGTSSEETTRYNNPNHVSRDNSMGYLMMLSRFGGKAEVSSFMWNTLMRGSFFQNTHTVKGIKKTVPDFCGPEQWALLIRAGFSKPMLILLYPLLMVLDVFLMLNYVWHVLQSFYSPYHTSTVFHMLSGVLLLKTSMQTPCSFIAEKVFLNCRKSPEGYHHKEAIVNAMAYYSRQTYDPPLEQLTEKVMQWIRK
jgi:hypothetical protein